jgi:elongator complex protein 3
MESLRSECRPEESVIRKSLKAATTADNVNPDISKVKILTTRYEASEGQEIFISAEDPENSVLVGYLRLRIPSAKAHRPEIEAVPSAIVRELRLRSISARGQALSPSVAAQGLRCNTIKRGATRVARGI